MRFLLCLVLLFLFWPLLLAVLPLLFLLFLPVLLVGLVVGLILLPFKLLCGVCL